MTYDDELILRATEHLTDADGKPLLDADGNQLTRTVDTAVLCARRSAFQSEYFNAATGDLKPGYVFVVHQYEYSGQREVVHRGNVFEVYRTYETGIEEIELHTREVIGR